MKAIGFDRYGDPADVLGLRDVPMPAVGDDGILVRVRAAALNPADWHLVSGVPRLMRAQLGLRRPRVSGLGIDLAGRVEAVGPAVTSFQPGDDVYGVVDVLPGTAVHDLGSVAEYVRVTEGSVRRAPSTLTAAEAAAVPLAATTALRGLRDVAGVQPGQVVMVNGASGGVGTFAVQIARALGAEVVGVCSTRNVDLVRSLGAGHVVDYTREDPTRVVDGVDVVLDNVGNHWPTAWRRVLRRDGTYLASFGRKERPVVGPLPRLLLAGVANLVVPQRLALLPSTWRADELEALTTLIESGQVTPVVDRTCTMADAPAAMAHLGTNRARGKVVVTVQED